MFGLTKVLGLSLGIQIVVPVTLLGGYTNMRLLDV